MAPKKIRYQSRSVETHVAAPRDLAWDDIVTVIRDEVRPAEELSFEPPWRFAYEMPTHDSALEFWQSTLLIRDDGPTCHVAWGLVFDPEPSDAALDESVEILADMQAKLDALAARLA
ncbi:MAG: hypothetical protein AAGE98_02895 [Actinomycetota bacterium]